MQRPIKFRAWNEKTRKMATPFYVINDDGRWSVENWMGEFSGEAGPSSFPLTIMQYSGRKDKNGVEIYEDDILMIPIKPKRNLFLVKWSDAFKKIALFQITKYGLNYHTDIRLVEKGNVVGNIYSNPELLKEGTS